MQPCAIRGYHRAQSVAPPNCGVQLVICLIRPQSTARSSTRPQSTGSRLAQQQPNSKVYLSGVATS